MLIVGQENVVFRTLKTQKIYVRQNQYLLTNWAASKYVGKKRLLGHYTSLNQPVVGHEARSV